MIRRKHSRRKPGTQDIKYHVNSNHARTSSHSKGFPPPLPVASTGVYPVWNLEADQIKARSRHSSPPLSHPTDDKWPSLQTRRNPHNQHLPKTIHNITRTTLRFKTRRPVEGQSAEEKPTRRHPTSQFQLLLLPPFFLLLCFCLCLRLLHSRVANNGTPRSQTTAGGVPFRNYGTSLLPRWPLGATVPGLCQS